MPPKKKAKKQAAKKAAKKKAGGTVRYISKPPIKKDTEAPKPKADPKKDGPKK